MTFAAIQRVIQQFDPPWPPDVLLTRDLPTSPPTSTSPSGHCRLIQATDGWLAVNLAREDDWNMLPAWLEEDVTSWEKITASIAQRQSADLLSRAVLLGLPISQAGETLAGTNRSAIAFSGQWAQGVRVVDLSALWAGPLCGGVLAAAGALVTKVESIARPDPTPHSTPLLNARINGRKSRQLLDFNDHASLFSQISKAQILITSARPHALSRLGLSERAVFAANPHLIWIAITAHGWRGNHALRVGFGDDCAAAGGLLEWQGSTPLFIGDAIADPLTGLMAASLAHQALDTDHSGLIDVSLAGCARWFAKEARLVP